MNKMQIRYNISGTIEVPEGSRLDESSPRMIILPSGEFVKLWTAVELNDVEDLTWPEQTAMGLDIEDAVVNLVVDDAA